MRERGQTGECTSLLAGHGADLGHFCNQLRAGDRANPWDRAENTGGFRQAFIARDASSDAVFQFLDQAIDPLLQLGIDVIEHHGGAKLMLRTDLGQQPLAHHDQLRSLGRQSSKKTQLFRWKTSTCFGPDGEEASDEFGIDTVGFGACATAFRKRLYLRGGQLAGCKAFRLKKRPEVPFLTSGRFKTNDSTASPAWLSGALPV